MFEFFILIAFMIDYTLAIHCWTWAYQLASPSVFTLSQFSVPT